MSDLFSVEVVSVASLTTLDALKKAKVFQDPERFYRFFKLDHPDAPECPVKPKTVDQLLAPLAAYAGDKELGRYEKNAFVIFARHLAHPDRTPSPLPVSQLTLRIRETHPQAGMPKEVGLGRFLAGVLALRSPTNPMRVAYGDSLLAPYRPLPGVVTPEFFMDGPVVLLGGKSGKAKTVTNESGAPRKEAEVSVLLSTHWVPDVVAGMRWDTGFSA